MATLGVCTTLSSSTLACLPFASMKGYSGSLFKCCSIVDSGAVNVVSCVKALRSFTTLPLRTTAILTAPLSKSTLTRTMSPLATVHRLPGDEVPGGLGP